MGEGEILGTSKVQRDHRISLVKGVRDELPIYAGDRVVFRKRGEQIVIEPATDTNVVPPPSRTQD